MAGKLRGRFISERDWPDWRKLLGEFRAVGRTLRRPGDPPVDRRGRGEARGFGKLNQSVTAGNLSSGESLSVWKGPAFSPDADTGRDLEIHYATHDGALDDYVTWSRIGGKVYVTPWICP